MSKQQMNARRYYNLVQQENTADIYIYGDITSWPWLESDVSSYDLAAEIDGLDVDEMHVYINSYGGEVAEGVAIYAALCRHRAKVVTHCDGFACSAASVVFMAGDERLISDLGMLMIHEAWTSERGNAAALRKAADDVEKISKAAANAFRGRVNIDDDELAELLAAETWLPADDALAKGFATGIEKWPETPMAGMSGRTALLDAVRRGLDMAEDAAKVQQKPKKAAPKAAKPPEAKPAGRKFFNFKQTEEE